MFTPSTHISRAAETGLAHASKTRGGIQADAALARRTAP